MNITVRSADISDFVTGISKDLDLIARLVAEEIYEKAAQNFSEAIYDGVNDVVVSAPEKTDDGYKVTAEGDAVAFIEFGAGVYHNGDGTYPDLPEGVGGIGSYGDGNGNKPWWIYSGHPGNAGGEYVHGRTNATITHGNAANMCLLNAFDDAMNDLPRIVREATK